MQENNELTSPFDLSQSHDETYKDTINHWKTRIHKKTGKVDKIKLIK